MSFPQIEVAGSSLQRTTKARQGRVHKSLLSSQIDDNMDQRPSHTLDASRPYQSLLNKRRALSVGQRHSLEQDLVLLPLGHIQEPPVAAGGAPVPSVRKVHLRHRPPPGELP
jgi:hypothetical protein